MSKCGVCGLGPQDGVTVYRENEPGELPAVWRCRQHREKPTDPETQRVVDTIEGGDF